jgi:hypothetical protein
LNEVINSISNRNCGLWFDYILLFHDRAKRIWDKEIVQFNMSTLTTGKDVTGASDAITSSSGKNAKKPKVNNEDDETVNPT